MYQSLGSLINNIVTCIFGFLFLLAGLLIKFVVKEKVKIKSKYVYILIFSGAVLFVYYLIQIILAII